MAWNGSGKEKVEVEGQGQQRRGKISSSTSTKHFTCKALIAGLVVVIGGGLAAWLMMRGEKVEDDDGREARPSQIVEVKPQIATNAVDEAPKELPLAMKRDHSELSRHDLLTKVPGWAYTVEDRKRLDPGYAARHERFLKQQESKIWKTPADNMLAMLIFNKGRLGPMPPFNAGFKDVFLKSLETPIIPAHDDPLEVQEQKRQMNETKIWLKEQLDDGKDIVGILNDEYKRQKKVTALHDSLRRELFQMQKEAKSVQEVEDYVAAANKMLEEAGGTQKIAFPTQMTKVRLEREATNKEK